MFPILYENITAGVIPSHNGLGVLSDAISCRIEQERNGKYQLVMEYSISGIHAQELTYRRIIKAKPNFTDNPQLFRIDRIGKEMNGVFTIYANHISYDLSGYEITSGTASSATLACALLQSAASGYTITTDKTTTGNFKITEPSSVRSWFAGKAGSFLDVFGTAELKYDNFNIQFLLHAGQDRGEKIMYGKNLLELSQEITDTLYTHVRAFWRNEDTIVLGTKISTGLVLDVPKEYILDCSSDYEEQPSIADLDSKTTAYINSHNLTTPSNNIKLDFAQSGELTGRVDLCDTVSIYYEALGITRAQVKCIRTVWDCIREKYVETEFGDAKTNLADTMVATSQAIAEKPSKTYLAEAVDRATKLITGNLGGYVILHDSNGDGEPDEILIMDTPDIETCQKIWRWNKSGLGYSNSGYSGEFGLAITSMGEIVADFITVGSLSGNRVRTGAIVSQNNQLIMDLDNGTITAPFITLAGQDVGSTLSSLVQTSVETRYALSNSGTVIPSTFPLTDPTEPTEQQPYLWSRTIYTYANGQTSTGYGVSVRGAKGADGADGAGLNILGNYATMAELIAAHPTGSAGDAYMVDVDLVVWNTQTSSWQDVGRIQGANGADGLWLAIDNDDDVTQSNVTYTAHLLRGNSDVTTAYNSVFAWYMVKESGITEIATGTPTITVARDSADYGATIRCVCIAVVDEEDLEDYSYVAITDYSGNIIQVIGSNNVKLIGESAIYKPYAISSQFQVLSNEISSKVSQTDFNSLSGTVTQQGTEIQQNAEAITLKANTSTVNTQLNGKMATDMSNRSSSITINSGEIKFESNSVSVNATNLVITKTGQVTSVDFQAKNSLRLLDANNNQRGYLSYNAVGGTSFVEKNQSGNTVAVISAADSDGGQLRLYNPSGTQTANIDGKTGNVTVSGKITGDSFGSINLKNANNNSRALLYIGNSDDGTLNLYNTSGSNTINLSGASGNISASGNITASGRISGGSFGAVSSVGAVSGTSLSTTGNITASGTITASGKITGSSFSSSGGIVCGGLTAKTQIVAADNSGVTKVFFAAGTSGYGALRNNSGDNNIYFYGESGNIEIAGRVIQGSSRKIKKNIKPIEDSEKILLLDAVSFDYINEEVGIDRRGFIAEDVAEVLPNLVQPESEGHNASLDYIGMIPYLQDIIKKQQIQIDYLMAEVEKLKGEK